MDTNNNVTITGDLPESLAKASGLKDLPSKQSFLNILKLDKAVVYLLVDWSGPERVSRYFIYKALNELDNKNLPVFKIDCSDQTKEYVVEWLAGQGENKKYFYYGGWGETLLIAQGIIVDVIENPGKLGLDKTKAKLNEWGSAATIPST
ncbi:MAG: hypothetical protein V4722_00130 [Bacteroidota bacterium]